MQKVRVPLTNFQFGEVSPSLYSRTDSPVYNASAQRVQNFFLRAEGGVIKRAGLRHIYSNDLTVDDSTVQQSRLMPFVFSDDERYIIAIEDLKVKVFQISPTTGDVSLIQTITQDVNSNALKFTDTYLHELTYAQAGDVLFICHPTFIPQQIVRTGLTTFQVESFVFDARSDLTALYQPYYSFQQSGVTLSSSATTGNGVTLTTSAPYFTTSGAHDGVTLRYHGQEIEITSVTSSTVATGNILDELKVQLMVNAFRTTQGTSDIEVTLVEHGLKVGDAITISNSGSVGGISNSQLNISTTVTSILDDDRFIFDCGQNANVSEDGGGSPRMATKAATTSWEEQSFSVLRGYPSAIAFHQNRLVFAGTLSQPDSVWMSKSGKFYNFDVGDAKDNDSIQVTASVGDINQILHISSNRDLQIFTATSEMYIPAFTNQPLTPTTVQIQRQTPFGSSFVRPQALDGATLFVQKGGAIVREYLFTDSEDAYTAVPVSSISSHLIRSPIEMNTMYGAMSRSESYVFIVNNDGTLAVFNSNRAEQRAGWTEFTTSGKFHSTVTIDDRVFANVVMDLGGGDKIVLCEFEAAANMDSSKVFSGSAGIFDVSSVFSNGAVVDVVNGTEYLGQFTVASGNLDVSAIDPDLSSAEVGFSFPVNLTTNPIDVQASNGPVTGSPRSLGSVTVDLNNTLSVSVNGTNLVLRNVTDDLSLQPLSVTGKKEFRLMGYNRDPQVVISQSAPLPLQVNGLIAELII